MLSVYLFSAVSTVVFIMFHRAQPTPYMDESAHIPQGQRFCKGDYQVSERITTPPGLYYYSLAVLKPLSAILGRELCDPWHLRLTSFLFSVGSACLYVAITRKLHPDADVVTAMLSTFNMTQFPVWFFISFFYYTEAGSVFLIMLAYLHRLKGAETRGAFFGALSLFFRQTNIAWVFFMGCDKMSEILTRYLVVEKKSKEDDTSDSLDYLYEQLRTLAKMPLKKREMFLNMINEIIGSCLPYIVVGFGFLVFVYWNQGVVVGDRLNHQVVLHLPQFLYFLIFLLIFASPYFLTINCFSKFLEDFHRRINFVIASMSAMALSLIFLHYDHHYLEDERHLVVIIWKNFFREGLNRFCYIPLYYFSAWMLCYMLKNKDPLWKLLFLMSVALSVVPQALVELRYFILPYLFCRLHMNVNSRLHMLVELSLFTCVNCLMFYFYAQPPYVFDLDRAHRFFW